MTELRITAMTEDERQEVAELIHYSTNGWYQQHYGVSIFSGAVEDAGLFCEVYETLDPGCCLIARKSSNQFSNQFPSDSRIVGSCFYHPRETHVSLGILNVHPEVFGQGVARSLLTEVIGIAGGLGLPLRLVSSVMNLDSYSLYNRAGMIPRQLYQDMVLEVPQSDDPRLLKMAPIDVGVSAATAADVLEMVDLEQQVSGIRRPQDLQYIVENRLGIWDCCLKRGERGLEGWCASIAHPASTMIGPCVAKDETTARCLLEHQLRRMAGKTVVFLLPVECQELIQTAYRWGARNCEMHVLQVLGEFRELRGIFLPTFMPETG
jgi:GNAT superfamily N-acetyltransferase